MGEMKSADPVNACVHPAIAGVLSALPHPEEHWPEIERAKWMCALGAVLDLVYAYPAPPHDPESGSFEPGDRPHD